MAIVARGTQSGTATASGAFTVSHSAVSSTDVIILAVANAGTAGPTAPTGWNNLGTYSAGAGQSISLYWAFLRSNPSMSWTDSASDAAWATAAFAGCDPVSPVKDGLAVTHNTTSNTTLPTGAPITGAFQTGDYEVLAYAYTSNGTISGVASGSTIDKTQANSTTISVVLGHNNTIPIAAATTCTAFSQTLSGANAVKTGIGLLLNVQGTGVYNNENELTTEYPASALPMSVGGAYSDVFPANMGTQPMAVVTPGSLASHRNSHRSLE